MKTKEIFNARLDEIAFEMRKELRNSRPISPDEYQKRIYEMMNSFFDENRDALDCWYRSKNFALKQSPKVLVLSGKGQLVIDYIEKSITK